MLYDRLWQQIYLLTKASLASGGGRSKSAHRGYGKNQDEPCKNEGSNTKRLDISTPLSDSDDNRARKVTTTEKDRSSRMDMESTSITLSIIEDMSRQPPS